jgi:transposase
MVLLLEGGAPVGTFEKWSGYSRGAAPGCGSRGPRKIASRLEGFGGSGNLAASTRRFAVSGGQEGPRTLRGNGRLPCEHQYMVEVVRQARGARAAYEEGSRLHTEAYPSAKRRTRQVHRGRAVERWLHVRHVDRPHDRPTDAGEVRGQLPQSSRASFASPDGFLRPAPQETPGESGSRAAGNLVARTPTRDQKKAYACRGVILYEDEASFWLDGTLHQTWSRIGVQPRVDTFGQRKTAHVFGAISLGTAAWHFRFAEVFNGHTFYEFLLQLVEHYMPVFLIIDNGPSHWLDDEGKTWLERNPDKMELVRLPPYSPEFNPTEGVWKATRKFATHNRFYNTAEERDAALTKTFVRFQKTPSLIAAQVRRFQGPAA